MRSLIVSESFPPLCGGSGWSTYEVARGLRQYGVDVLIVRPRPGQPAGIVETSYDGFEVLEFGAAAPRLPYVRNYFKNERLTRLLRPALERIIRTRGIDVVHGAHVLSTPAAIAAAAACGVPSVATIRDYWPVCYWADLIFDYDSPDLCPACSAGMMTQCVRPRAGAAWPLALPMIPYMRRNLARKASALSRADAVVAVSSAIARDLYARAPEVARERIQIIPNPVDLSAVQVAARLPRPDVAGPYAIYSGKLAPNKGTGKLLDAVTRSSLVWPLIIVGDGPDRARVEADAARAQRDVRFTGWLPREEALRWLAHATIVIFPSYGPESLSRVLLESSALGLPVAAMETGGTRDIIDPERTGLLSTTVEGLAADITRLADDEALRERLGRAAREKAMREFDSMSVARRVLRLYEQLLDGRRPRGEARRGEDGGDGAQEGMRTP